MSANFAVDDLRSNRTERALFDAMFSLLKVSSFKKVTIKGICEAALVSRAAFYAHFIDKFDLLKHWLVEIWPNHLVDNSSARQSENAINDFLVDNMMLLKNLLSGADSETIGVLFDFFLTTINLSVDKTIAGESYSKNVVLAHFYAGGLISYITWQVENRFPHDVPPINEHLHNVIRDIRNMQTTHELEGDDE